MEKRTRQRLRGALVRTGLVVGSLAFTILLLEISLRYVPGLSPRGTYGAPRISDDLHLRVHAEPPVYNRARWTRRSVNPDGFLDVSHVVAKPPDVVRVGFFGDSYVEAVSVPLEETFFRKIPAEISGRAIEPFAFAISGWGTLHCLLAYRVLGRRYDLDYVVYVFSRNDPGDQHPTIRPDSDATATLTDDPPGFTVLMRARQPEAFYERAEKFAERNLILARVIRALLQNNLKWSDDREAGSGATQAKIPNQNDYPSTWPPALLDDTKEIARRILKQFRDEVVHDGRRFAVLYVPRGDEDLEGKLAPEESWWPWLSQTCDDLGIRLLNPRDLLSRRHADGLEILR